MSFWMQAIEQTTARLFENISFKTETEDESLIVMIAS